MNVSLDLVVEVGAPAHGGHCVARLPDGRVAFVRHALPGERVRVAITEERRTYVRADAVEVLSPSPDRVEPPCPYAGPGLCGGCDLQHASPAAQREWKTAVVREQLTRLAGLSPAEVDELGVRVSALPPGDPLGWRTRVQYTVDRQGRLGLFRHRSHDVLPVDRCLIAHPATQPPATVPPGASTVEAVASSGGDVTVVAAYRSGRTRIVSGPARVRERAVGREWTVDAEAFWQVHPAAPDAFAAAVLELLDPGPGYDAFPMTHHVECIALLTAAR